MPEDYLQHHGVLGMKWGRRKSRKSGEGRRKKASKSSSKTKKSIFTKGEKAVMAIMGTASAALLISGVMHKPSEAVTGVLISPAARNAMNGYMISSAGIQYGLDYARKLIGG